MRGCVLSHHALVYISGISLEYSSINLSSSMNILLKSLIGSVLLVTSCAIIEKRRLCVQMEMNALSDVNPLKSLNGVDQRRCMLECARYQGCLAFNYTRLHGICALLPGPCLTTATWRCRKNFSQWECSFHWKLRCRWLEFLQQRQIAVIRQGPGPKEVWQTLFCSNIWLWCVDSITPDRVNPTAIPPSGEGSSDS